MPKREDDNNIKIFLNIFKIGRKLNNKEIKKQMKEVLNISEDMSGDKMKTGIKTTSRLGLWSAILSFIFSIAYLIAQGAEFLGLLGPQGGPISLILLMLPSLFLASSFIILIVSIHYYAPEDKKILSHIGLAFAIIYAVLISIVYYVQLTLVVPNLLRETTDEISVFIFTPFNSFLFALDVLGYGFMNLATLFVAFVFKRKELEKWIRRFLIANGVLFPTNILSMVYPPLLWLDAPWAITFPVSTILLAMLFKRGVEPEYEEIG